MKVSACLKGSPDSHGRQAVYVRISNHGHRSYSVIHPPIRVLPKQFKGGKVVDHPEKDLLNKKILQAIIETEIAGGFKKADTTFLKDFVNQSLKQWSQSRSEETMRYYRSKAAHYLEFAGNIPLTSINPGKYKDYLVSQGVKDNNLWSYLKFLRTLKNKALREDLLTGDPFKGFEMPKYKDPPKAPLFKVDVAKIEKVKNLPDELEFCRIWFLIGCYCGYRYGDMHTFDKKKHLKGGRLTLYTSKMGEVVSLPLEPKIKKLFEAIDYQPLHYSNVHYNRCLKQIGEVAGIGPLNAHLSRHTFGTMLAEAGVSQEVAAKLMGHGSLKSTAIYYKITPNRSDDEFRKLF